jgi:Cu(I)/Ag(I) efflux system protein CusF
MNARQTSLALALVAASTLACAGGKAAASAPQAADASVAMTEGEVRKVDLDMPGMTMVFQVKDPSLLAKVKAGDKVRFTAEKINGGYSVTNIEAVK